MRLAFKIAGVTVGCAGLFWGLLSALDDLAEYRKSRER